MQAVRLLKALYLRQLNISGTIASICRPAHIRESVDVASGNPVVGTDSGPTWLGVFMALGSDQNRIRYQSQRWRCCT